jgi:hypothetical protein
MVWVKLRWLEPTRHKRGLLGGCDAHTGGLVGWFVEVDFIRLWVGHGVTP